MVSRDYPGWYDVVTASWRKKALQKRLLKEKRKFPSLAEVNGCLD